MQNVQLPNFYYLDNFTQLIDHVFDNHKSILRPSDLEDHNSFCLLSRNAKALYVRFLMRKGTCFRLEKISYSEIPNLIDCLSELELFNFISWDSTVTEKIKLFSKAELRILFPREFNSKLSRFELEEAMLMTISDIPEKVLKIKKDFKVFNLLYFGNLHQDLSEFILNDLGIYRYEKYDLSHGFINSISELEEFLNFYSVIAEYDRHKALEFFNNYSIIKSTNAVLKRRLDKFHFSFARQLERQKFFEEALEIYSLSKRSGERQARVLGTLKKYDQLETKCLQMLDFSKNDQEKEFAQFFLSKNSKFLSKTYDKLQVYIPPTELLELDKTDLSVERAACEYYTQFGHCYHAENLWANALFGLFFWQVIFANVPGAFSHPFQHRPHDLYEPDFYENRKTQITELMEKPFTWAKAEKVYQSKFGLSNPFVNWGAINKDYLRLALENFNQEQIKSIFIELLKDLRNKKKGFPDLIYFPHQGGVELIEIKAPGDRLQKHQNTWLKFFEENKIKARVVNVSWN
ncbi:VRR-NUC domain-containing protein [Lentisphaera marina]|uniref:VRR-NUC domain-containing protein n=1 Tax=Lentisphaera marina TaxID=1111041 RepID=UPI0030822A35